MKNITFSDEDIAGDIPEYEITLKEINSEHKNFLQVLLNLRNGKVIICFQKWDIDEDDFNQFNEFLVSDCDVQIYEYYLKLINDCRFENVKANFFCFHTYEEAFRYLIDLKEGL